jgi:hypothetical protein
MIFNVVHETGLLEVEASVEVFKEDEQIFCDVQNWSVEGVRMPISALSVILADVLVDIATDEFQGV